MAAQTILGAIHACPRCRQGKLFAGFLKLHEKCSECGLVYERETGQAWGAMVVAYGFSAVIALPLFFLLLFNRVDTRWAVGIPVLVLLAVAPLNVRISRLLWANWMYLIHPDRPA